MLSLLGIGAVPRSDADLVVTGAPPRGAWKLMLLFPSAGARNAADTSTSARATEADVSPKMPSDAAWPLSCRASARATCQTVETNHAPVQTAV